MQQATESSSSHADQNTGIEIEYVLVKDDRGSYAYKRFAAFVKSSATSKRPLNIYEWAKYLSAAEEDDNDSDNRSDEFIDQLTNLINQATKQQQQSKPSSSPLPSPYQAYFFETKGATFRNAHEKQFEFVVIDSTELAEFCNGNGPTPHVFADKFSSNCPPHASDTKTCCSFPNIGHNAMLVSPVPRPGADKDYSHIGKFLRDASVEEIRQLWRMVAGEYLKQLSLDRDKSMWLSTSGMGVSWLHFRIDQVPKYYTFREFANES